MKSILAALAASALLFFSVGCGGETENMSAVYPPPPPTGTDGPAEEVASSEMPNAPQAQVSEENAQAYAQPRAGDIQVGADANEYADTDPAALTDFKPALDPYGTWYEDASYGTVWTPSATVVGADFAPYVTAGHWAYEDDYVWVSDYDWGWAPFHYGRWVYISGRGWSWIPGRTYAGAWVTWRYGYDDWAYVGWAPMPPTWYWYGGYAVGIGYVPVAPYVFCHSSYMFNPYVGGHIVTGTQVPVVASHTRPYVPASPSVGAGPGGRVGANPSVGGPPPKSLGLNSSQVPRAPASNVGLLHAQQFAKPATAQTLGARAPTQFAHASPGAVNPGPAHAASSAFAGPSMQHGSTTLGGAHAPVAASPQYRGIAPSPQHAAPYSAPSHLPSVTQSPQHFSPPAHYASPSYSAPGARPAPSYSAPSYHPSAPSYSAPSYHAAPSYSPAPSFHSSAPSFHSAAPSYHSSAPSYSSPSVHSSAGGGFHGGGGAVRGGRR